MRLFCDLSFIFEGPCVLALGCFDGVHLGHRAVIGAAKEIADKEGLPLAVFTFEQPPKNFFSVGSVPLITSAEDKLRIFEELGVAAAVCLPLSVDVLSMKADDFINDMIFRRLNAKHVVCGYDYSFGKGATGTPKHIRAACKRYGARLTVIPEQKQNGATVSSSLIRKLVTEGDVMTAASYLGRPFSLSSTVVDGQHLARTLGFPTVNTVPEKGLLLPKRGVYVTRARFASTHRYGITNVGIRPTVGTEILCAETHIFDFEGNLYGQRVTVEFLRFLRPEIKFDSVESMAKQIRRDITEAKTYIESIEEDKLGS